ncbi:unnamed protein product [Closterium sp. NIES-64]|nr:unnamed protein product [Closterium sp. NIES-64]
MFDESVPFYRLFPYHTAPLPPSPLFLAPGPPPVDPLPPQGPAPLGVSQVNPVKPVEVAVDSGAARGGASGGAEPSGAEFEGAEPGGAEPEGAESEGAESGGAEPTGAKPGGAKRERAEGAEPKCAKPGGPSGVLWRAWSLSLHYSCANGLLGAGASKVVLLELELLEVLEPLVPKVLVLEVLELLGLEVLLELPELFVLLELELLEVLLPLELLEVLELLELEVLLELELLEVLELELLEVLELLEMEVLLELELELLLELELELLLEQELVEVLVLSVLVLEVLCDRDRTSFHYFSSRTGRRVLRPRPPPVPGMHQMALRPSSVPLRIHLPSPPTSSLADGPDPEVKRPPGSPPVFKARYVARGFSQRQGVDFFQTFSPTPKMTTPWVLLHVAAQRDYELHSLDFSTASLQRSLHEEIWLRRPPGFTGSFPPSTQWSLRWLVYGLCQVPRKWHDTLRTTLAALGFAPSIADPSLFLCTDPSLLPFYIVVYVDDLVFATADTSGLAQVKSELQKRHMCTDLGELRSYLGLQITRDRARRTITLTQSHMVQQVH